MASPSPDDYARLTSPWKPLPEFAVKNITSIQNRIEIDRGTMVSGLASVERGPSQVELISYRMETQL